MVCNAGMHGEAPNDTDPRVEAVLVAGCPRNRFSSSLESPRLVQRSRPTSTSVPTGHRARRNGRTA
jgi:hypothetical protein